MVIDFSKYAKTDEEEAGAEAAEQRAIEDEIDREEMEEYENGKRT